MDSLWSVKADSIFSSVTGFIKKKHKCPACFNILEINTNMDNITTKACFKKGTSFNIEIFMPMVICEHCHRKVIIRKNEFTDQIELALGDALKEFKF